MIDGGKQKERVKGNKVSGHTAEGDTMWVGCVCSIEVAAFVGTCKETRREKTGWTEGQQ